MPYRGLVGGADKPERRLMHLARWCNRQFVRKACTFEEYLKRKGEKQNS